MPQTLTLALFGEAETGLMRQGVLCETLPQLIDIFGHPPASSQGLVLAIQALLYGRRLIYFRVKEEGFSSEDYFEGIEQLEKSEWASKVAAYGIPGVGDSAIIHAIIPICAIYHSILITSQADLQDYLTSS